MIELPLSEKDLLFGRVFQKGWYPAELKKYEVQPNKKDPAFKTHFVNFELIGGQDDNGPAAGGEVVLVFRSDNIKFFMPALRILIPDIETMVREKRSPDGSALVGMKIDLQLSPKPNDDDKMQNNIVDFAPYGKMTNRVAEGQ